MANNLIKVGQPIPLVIVLGNGATNKVILANLYDQSTGELLTPTPLTLPPVTQGWYQNNTFPMPAIDRVIAIYDIFDETNYPYQFNALVVKLDNDAGLATRDYFTLSVNYNDPFSTWLTNFNSLLTKLDNDTGTTDKDYESLLTLSPTATVNDLVSNYNALLVKLDNDTGLVDQDYSSLLMASFNTPSTDTDNTGSDTFILETNVAPESSSGGGTTVGYIGEYAHFLFFSDVIATPEMVTVFYIQEDQPASVTTANKEPYLNLKDTVLTLVPNSEAPLNFVFDEKHIHDFRFHRRKRRWDHREHWLEDNREFCDFEYDFEFDDEFHHDYYQITSSIEISSFINHSVHASGISGISGVTATAANGMVTIATNNTGQLATLEVTTGNTPLGIPVQSVTGSEQQRVILSDLTIETKTDGNEQLVSFLLDRKYFVVDRLYFVEFNDGVTTSVQKLQVLRKKNNGTVNFVAKVP